MAETRRSASAADPSPWASAPMESISAFACDGDSPAPLAIGAGRRPSALAVVATRAGRSAIRVVSTVPTLGCAVARYADRESAGVP